MDDFKLLKGKKVKGTVNMIQGETYATGMIHVPWTITTTQTEPIFLRPKIVKKITTKDRIISFIKKIFS